MARILKSVTEDAAKKLVNGMIISRLDYCKSLLSASKLNRLQRVQIKSRSQTSRQKWPPREYHTCPSSTSLVSDLLPNPVYDDSPPGVQVCITHSLSASAFTPLSASQSNLQTAGNEQTMGPKNVEQ